MKLFKVVFFLMYGISLVFSQIKVVNIQKIDIGGKAWNSPQFSKDGEILYLTTDNYNGIWEYSLNNKILNQITADEGAGYGFDVSSDGKLLAYRKTINADEPLERKQEIVLLNLSDKSSLILEKGIDLSTPVINNNAVVYSSHNKTKNLTALKNTGIKVLGIENTKIILNKNGEKITFDPLGNGSYIWPSLSPDGNKLLSYEMSIGAFICNIDGTNIKKLGKRNAPQWTRDGKWIIYMKDKDDGYQIISSDIYAVSPNSEETVQLTDTKDIIELYPSCSPTENKIVFSALNGEIYILSYEVK